MAHAAARSVARSILSESEPIIRIISAAEATDRSSQLTDLLVDCVNGGASVSFLAPLARDTADRFWHGVIEAVASGDRLLLVAEEPGTDQVIGTAEIIVTQPENQPHRGDLAKLLVHSKARRRGVGEALLRAVETTAWDAGKTLLVLDTEAGSNAERLYDRLGWVRVGDIPDLALTPDGHLAAAAIFYKRLGP